MSHEIEDDANIAWTNEVPWHGLGTDMGKNQSLNDWIKAAKLNWTLEKTQAEYKGKDGRYNKCPDRFVMHRSSDDKFFGICGKIWKPWQNREMLEFMYEFVKAGGATLETIGSLRGGSTIWGLANLKHDFQVSRGDKVKGFLLMTTSHIVGRANTIRSCNTRVVCANTMASAEMEGVINYRQNHLTEFNTEKAREAIHNAHEQLAAAERRYKTLLKFKLTEATALQKVFAPIIEPELCLTADVKKLYKAKELPKSLTSILSAYNNAPGASPGNGWGALNAVTYWTDHMAGRTDASRLYNVWVGHLSRRKRETEARLMELAS